MSSHPMNRPAPISVFSDQRRTKSTIWSRVSCGTQTPIRVPQLFFLGQRVPPSVRPKLHPSSGSSAPDRRFVPVQADSWSVPFVGKPPLRSRKTPSASGRTRSAAAQVRRIDPRSALLPPNAASEWQPFLPACSASVASSCVRSVILTEERFLHFQLRHDNLIVFFLALAVVGVLVYVVRKITGRNRYTDMTDHEFEAEAKRTSPAFGLMLAIQLRASDKTTTCIRIFFA